MHIATKILLVTFSIAIFIIAFYVYRFYRLVKISESIIVRTTPYTLSGDTSGVSLLVLGDSIAVGVGADTPEESIAGRLAKLIGATRVENRGVSGAVVADVATQVAHVEEGEYDTILLQIAGNDMTRLHRLSRVAPEFEALIENLPKHGRLIVLTCGNLGGAGIFPRVIGYIYEHISRTYHAKLREIVTKHGGIYVDLFDERDSDPFVREPKIYLAPDYFHPSSRGYEYWFAKVEAEIK